MVKNKKRPKPWFKKIRGSYLPCSWQGWLCYIPFVGYLMFTMVVAFGAEQPLTAILYGVFPGWVAAAVAMTWLASVKSR